MAQKPISNLFVVAAGLAGLAATFAAPQNASAFGQMGGFGGRGGMAHGAFGPSAGRGRGSISPVNVQGSHLRGVFGRHPTSTGNRHPDRVPPIRITFPPHRYPPIFIPPYHRWPHLPPRIVVQVPPRIIPVYAGGSQIVTPAVRPLSAVAAPSACINDGSFVSIVFVPTVTAADITAFLKAYKVTMADGPNADGVYRIRLSTSALPQNDILQVIDSMRSQTEIVSSVAGA